jgi:riboflavin kinase/FMN adenylyltransferase
MEILSGLGSCPELSIGSAVTIGAYDGVHLGHRALIRRVRHLAAELGCASAVVTFDQHPARVVRPESAPLVLTDLPQKLELLATTGIDYTLVLPFDRERSEESAEDFVREVLVGCLRVRAVVVGHDFHFGHARRGNVSLLQEMGATYGFEVHGITLVSDGSQPVSSTRVRDLLAAGEVTDAAVLLDREHEVRGVVAAGGDAIEIPAEIQLPADGAYAGHVAGPDGARREALIRVGERGPQVALLRVGLLDGDGRDGAVDGRAGEAVRVQFAGRLSAPAGDEARHVLA